MTKKKSAKPKTRKPMDDICRVTSRMPEWMREYLAEKGIESQFSPSTLTIEQCLAVELAERLLQKEVNGLIRVTYDPQIDPEPKVEITDYAKDEYRQRSAETGEEDPGEATQETPDGEIETGEDV
jgi:hypothetical protein